MIGAIVAVVVLVAGAAVIFTRGSQWTANTTLVLLPGQSISQDNGAGYYDTLSSGQLTATASQILGLQRFKNSAGAALHLDKAQLATITVTANVATGSSIINLSVSGPDPRDVEHLADGVVDQATSTINGLVTPYQLSVVSRAVGTASTSSGLSSSKYLVILVIVALAMGLGAQQATNQIRSASRRSRRGPAPPPASPGPERSRSRGAAEHLANGSNGVRRSQDTNGSDGRGAVGAAHSPAPDPYGSALGRRTKRAVPPPPRA